MKELQQLLNFIVLGVWGLIRLMKFLNNIYFLQHLLLRKIEINTNVDENNKQHQQQKIKKLSKKNEAREDKLVFRDRADWVFCLVFLDTTN